MALELLNGPIIAAGESLSSSIDCRKGEIVRVTMPADWTGAPLTFQGSSDGTNYQDVCDYRGEPIAINVTPGTAVIFPSEWARAVAFLKFRSGTRDFPVLQAEQRQFTVALKVPGGGPSRSGKRK